MPGNKFRECRAVSGLTQRDAAQKLGISIGSLCTWEKEKANPSVMTLCKMADLYGVSTDQLLGRKPLIAKD